MVSYDRITLGRLSKELGFVRDTFEKVCRLIEVLRYLEQDFYLFERLALKGGTAINLTFFTLPRLSVDIDLDYSRNLNREEMLLERKVINDRIQKFMISLGYTLSPRTKLSYALDSFVYEYMNAGGVKDNIKIEINYMCRTHIFPERQCIIKLPWENRSLSVLALDPVEIFASKAVALITRAAARDLYDMFNLVKSGLMRDQEIRFRKSIIFYAGLASSSLTDQFDFKSFLGISERKIKTELLPVLRRGEAFNLNEAQNQVERFLTIILRSEQMEMQFLHSLDRKEYRPELLFEDPELSRVRNHPMAIWKCSFRSES